MWRDTAVGIVMFDVSLIKFDVLGVVLDVQPEEAVVLSFVAVNVGKGIQ